MLYLTVLGSGSSGNAALIESGGTKILVDAGLSAKQISLRLDSIGVPPDGLDGIFLTHEHGDHVRGLDVFCHRFGTPVFCTALTREVLAPTLKREKRWKLIPGNGAFSIGAVTLETFAVPHDAVEPVGVRFSDGDSVIGLVSDVGYVTDAMRRHLRGVDTLFLEANYDEMLLRDDTKRPLSTKQRISARHGHLSNTQAAELLADIAGEKLERVVLGHLSDDCNCPETAEATARDSLAAAGAGHVDVVCASRDAVTGRFPARREEPGRAVWSQVELSFLQDL